MKIKYIIFDEILPVLFSEGHQHKAYRQIGIPTSAGFCAFEQIEDRDPFSLTYKKKLYKVTCWGESISLGIKSNPEWDESIIKRLLEN